MSLSDQTNRKFTDVIELDDWLIDTPTGWEDLTCLNQTIEYDVYKIKFISGNSIDVADTHIFIDEFGNEIYAKDSVGVNIRNRTGIDKVESIIINGSSEQMYDVTVNANHHTFYSNDIVSHNTQTTAAYIVHHILFADNIPNVAIMANKGSAAREVMQRIQFMYEYLPKWMQKGVKTWNKGNIILEGENGADGAQVFTAATTASGPRGKSVSLLYIDEVSIIPNTVAEEFFASTYPIISSGENTKIIMSSTPKGYNHFWKYWTEAEAGINGFVATFAHYSEHPKRDQAWAETQRAMLGELKFQQECECSFLGSSATLIDASRLSKLAKKTHILKTIDGFDALEEPIMGHTYVMTVDPSKGVGGDYSTFSLIDVTNLPYRQVAKYRNNTISPMLFPSVIAKIASHYNEAFVLIEINISEQIPHILYNDIEYENVFTVARDKGGQKLSSGFGNNIKYGLQTDRKTKLLGCNNLKSLIEEGKFEINDADTINELSTFIDNGKGSYSADDGYHDDIVMTLVLFGWLSTQNYFKDLTNVDIRARMYEDRMKAIEDDMLPVGFYNDGQEEDAFMLM